MTNDKPKREDAPIAWRVSDEELANLTFKMSDPIALFKLAENLELDLQDERKRSKRLAKANAELIEERDHARAALDRCSDFAATLGIENDKLREDQKDWRHPMQKLQNENDALRAAVLDRADKLYASGHYIHANYLYEAHQKSGGVGTKAVADSGAEQCIDRPAASDYSTPAQILVRDGEPDIFRGAWIASLTPEHPLWLVYTSALAACGAAELAPGLYTVTDCEACGGTGKAGQYPPVGHSRMELTCPHCHEGKTLRRESEEG